MEAGHDDRVSNTFAFTYGGCKPCMHSHILSLDWRAYHVQTWPRNTRDRKVEHESHGDVIDMERSTFEAILSAVMITDSIGGWGSCDH